MKTKDNKLRTMTDVKIFILFLLDTVRYPIDHGTLYNIITENTGDILLDYDEALRLLVDGGSVYYDEFDGERYYMISDKGRAVSAELYDTLDPAFRQKAARSAARIVKLSGSSFTFDTAVREAEKRRFAVTLIARESGEELLNLTLTVPSRADADAIAGNFRANPTGVYRGILFAATGKLEYLS